MVTVIDPDAEAKKNGLSRPIEKTPTADWRYGAPMKPGRIKRFRNLAPVGNRSVNRLATRMSLFEGDR